jgi:Glycosyltransferase family 87
MRRLLDWLPVAIGIALLSTLVGLQWNRVIRGQNDFVALYVGGKLVGTPDLYSRAANEAMIQSILGTTMESVTYTRPPFYAALLKPLAALPYLTAYAIFCAICLFSILWFVVRFYKECPSLPLFASFCIPVAAFLPQGQDTPLLLMFAGVSILLTRQKKNFLAGLVLSLCAIKFHLFLIVPLLLLAKKQWRILGGAACGAGILFTLGVVTAGPQSTGQYVTMLRNPWINFNSEMMPNLHGLVATLGGRSWLEIGLAAVVLMAFFWLCYKTDDYEFLFALSLLCGLLVSFHSGIGDVILLLLVFVLIVHSCQDKALRIALAVTLTPLPYFIGVPIGVVLPLLFLLILILAVRCTASPSAV